MLRNDATSFSDFICPACNSALQESGGNLNCSGCGLSYPILQGVPLLLPGISYTAGPDPDENFVAEIARAALPDSAISVAPSLRELFATTVTFPDEQLGSEGHRFVHRLRASGHTIRNPDGTPPVAAEPTKPTATETKPNESPVVALRLLTLPTQVISGRGFGLQVRLANLGSSTLTSENKTPFNLSYFAQAPRKKDFREGHRTPLLVDIPPGGALTLPVFIEAPDRPGKWTYKITPLVESVVWLHDTAIQVTVDVLPETAPDPLAVDWPSDNTARDYGQDHVHGIALLDRWLRDRLGERPAPRILELGGNAAPQIADARFAYPNGKRYNLDIDPFGLVFGTVQRRFGGGAEITDLLGDGTHLPFADRSLDAIVMFATLHHFPDPIGLLRHLRTKLTPGGLVCVLCEPMGHNSRDTLPEDFRDELLGGICEQAFEAWEYRQFFHAAGLKVAHAMWDVGSLKVALEADDGVIEDPVRDALASAHHAPQRRSLISRLLGR